MIQHDVKSTSVERAMVMGIAVEADKDAADRGGSKRVFWPEHLTLRWGQASADSPITLTEVTLRGPRRLKDGTLSKNTVVNVNGYFWRLEAHELERLDLSFPAYVRELVEEYWPASI